MTSHIQWHGPPHITWHSRSRAADHENLTRRVDDLNGKGVETVDVEHTLDLGQQSYDQAQVHCATPVVVANIPCDHAVEMTAVAGPRPCPGRLLRLAYSRLELVRILGLTSAKDPLSLCYPSRPSRLVQPPARRAGEAPREDRSWRTRHLTLASSADRARRYETPEAELPHALFPVQ